MYFEPFLSLPERQNTLPETFRILEEKYGVVITVHDCFGRLQGSDGKNYLDLYMKHRHPFCLHLRKESGSCNGECIRNCLFHTESHARKEDRPFLHHCWKGAWELVVPIKQNGVLQFLFYIGVFRMEKENPPAQLQGRVDELYYALPVPDHNKLEELAYILISLGPAMLQCAAVKRPEGGYEYDRRSMQRHKIRNFLENHIHQPIRLKDLAEALCLSETRTSHLVKRLFSVSFQNMVEDERINRALNLLRNTELPLKNIAEKTGFKNEYYFSRVFRQHCGIPPGKYRENMRSGLEKLD